MEELLTELAGLHGLALAVSLRGEQRPFGPDWREALHARPLTPEIARSVFLAFAGDRFHDDPDLDPLLAELDGLALAVVLLASQAEGEPDLYALRQRWRDQRTALLQRSGGRERQHSLEVSLRLSFESSRMGEESLRLLSLLSLLPEGLAREDLPALLPGTGHEAASGLRKVGLAFDQGHRLRVLAPIREHVQRNHPPQNEDFDRLVDHHLTLARIGDRIGGAGGAEAADRLRSEMGNLEPMILAGLEREDPVPAIRAALAFTNAVRFTGVGELTLIGCALQAARDAAQLGLEADCLHKMGDIHLYRAHYQQAQEHYEHAQEIYQRAGDSHGTACGMARRAEIHLQQTKPDDARRLYEQALVRFCELSDPHWEAQSLLGLGYAAVQRAEKVGRPHLIHALALFRQLGDVRGEANCLQYLAQASLDAGDYADAREEYESALSGFRRVGSILGEASCLRCLGHIAVWQGNPQVAETLVNKALLLCRRVGSRLGEANCHFVLGEAARARFAHETAEELLQKALVLFRQLGQPTGVGNCLESLGSNAAARSDLPGAHRYLNEALRILGEIPQPVSFGRVQLKLARISTNPFERQAHLEAARQIWDATGELEPKHHELEEPDLD